MSDDIKTADRIERELGHKTQHTANLHHIVIAPLVPVTERDQMLINLEEYRREVEKLRAENERLKGDLSVANLRIEAKEKYSAKKNELSDRLIEWAQNNEMVDNKYTDHGKDCLEAAKLLKGSK